VTIAAFAVSLLALLIALGSLWYTHRADQRADGADHRDAARFTGEQIRAEVDALSRVGAVVQELAAAVEAAATDPYALRRVTAAQSRLEQAIGATGLELPACSTYMKETNPILLPEVERELGEAIARRRLYGS
jgi:hypothetical protein